MVAQPVATLPARRGSAVTDPTAELVTALLRERLDSGLECIGLERSTTGNAQEIWLVDARGADGSERPLVIRRSAAAGTVEETRRDHEYAVLRAIEGSGLPVPRVYWVEDAGSALGRPYLVMERMPGSPPGRLGEAARASVARQIGEWLARLHALEVEPPEGLGVAADAADATRAELARWHGLYERRRRSPVPILGGLFAWLERRVPGGGAATRLLWGDASPFNVLVERDRVTALLDWEFAHVGDPLEDLGVAVWSCLDLYDPAEVVAGYEAEAGPVDRAALRWFEVFAAVTRAVIVLGGTAAFLDGEPSPRLAALGQELLLDSLARGAAAAGWVEGIPARTSRSRLRPNVAETIAGVADFLDGHAASIAEPRLRRELRTAVALLDATVRRVGDETDDTSALEEALVRAEREDSSDGDAPLRAEALADLKAQQELVEPLARLRRGERRLPGGAMSGV